MPPEITFGFTGDARDSLELVLSRLGDTICFKEFFSDLWFMFGNAYRDGWVTPLSASNPVTEHSEVLVVSYSVMEDYDLDALRIAVYRFLRALCLKRTEQNANRARKIQIPFVKMLCHAAWKAKGDLSSGITFDSPIALAYLNDKEVYHSSCIPCPKLDRREFTSDFDSAVRKAAHHSRNFHQIRSKIALRNFAWEAEKSSKLKMSIEQYLIKLQENISGTNRAVAFLDLKEEAYWFVSINETPHFRPFE